MKALRNLGSHYFSCRPVGHQLQMITCNVLLHDDAGGAVACCTYASRLEHHKVLAAYSQQEWRVRQYECRSTTLQRSSSSRPSVLIATQGFREGSMTCQPLPPLLPVALLYAI